MTTTAAATDAAATRPPARRALVPALAVLASMSCVQLGSALSVPLFGVFGVAGTVWLRLAVAAAVLLVVAPPRGMARRDLAAAAGLGAVTAVNAVAFSAAIERIPLGARRPTALAWPAAALAGVVLITAPWRVGGADAGRVGQGIGLAAVAAAGWAGYILLSAHVGRRSEGLRGLAVAMAAGAAVLAPVGAVQAWPGLRAPGPALLLAAGVALLVPLAAYALEMAALRRLDQGVFGVWMALEPALGTAAGWAVLGQRPTPGQLPGLALVVIAGIGAARP